VTLLSPHTISGANISSLRDNEEAYNRYKIRPRILVNVSNLDTSTTIFGTKVTPRSISMNLANRYEGFISLGLRPSSHA
jgi:hypothetical protein